MEHWRLRIGVLVLGLALVVAACGDDDGGGEAAPEAQPTTEDTVFVSGEFGDIPLPPLADPAGERSEIDGVVAQSFFVRNRTPEAVLDFYSTYFENEGVAAIASPRAFGDAWRGTWLLDDRELLVSATPAPTAGGDDVTTQLSLELAPPGGGGHEGRSR